MYAKDLPHSLTGCTVYIDEERKVNVYSHARATQCSHTSHIAPVLLAQDMVLEARSLQCEDRWVHLHRGLGDRLPFLAERGALVLRCVHGTVANRSHSGHRRRGGGTLGCQSLDPIGTVRNVSAV